MRSVDVSARDVGHLARKRRISGPGQLTTARKRSGVQAEDSSLMLELVESPLVVERWMQRTCDVVSERGDEVGIERHAKPTRPKGWDSIALSWYAETSPPHHWPQALDAGRNKRPCERTAARPRTCGLRRSPRRSRMDF